MTKTKSTKRALLLSALSLLMCVSMLIGSTFAWFTDSVTSAGNKIQAGTLKVDLEVLDKDGNWNSIKEDKTALFNYDKWEPGYTEFKVLKIENEGSLALKWLAKFVSVNDLSILADVIDVYVYPSTTELQYPTDRNLNGYTKVGTVAQFVNTIKETTKGELKAGEAAYLGIALKMQESAGNTYQGLNLGGAFDIQIIATQLTYESDSFDDQYDKDANLDYAPVSNVNELKIALANKEENIVLTKNIEVTEVMIVDYNATINGAGHTISRANSYTDTMFKVATNAALTVEDAVIDGGAVWSNALASASNITNSGIVATGNLIVAESNASIILNEGAVLQNNDGAHAVNLGTRIGATLTMNGGWIINNRSGSGAVWGGGHITMNEGSKINNNISTGSAGAIRMVSNCNLTMNGGEISNNTAAGSGGAIWGYGASVYNLNGGEMSNNTAAAGGAIYTGDGSTINISGDFEMCNNTATDAGAMRLSNRTAFKMSGGKISGNVSTNSPEWNGFYGWNPGVNISGGELNDDICIQGGLTPTVGGSGINGVIHFDLSTNHNTANLAAEFGTIKFTVADDGNFSAFNFKPATGYVYTEGDEAKLVCLNDGYETYWDAATETFRLQAK